ncbi:two-component system sensor histidine kinase YesM [Anaerotaenia torta]|uniref:cache domain-containing sensor histidine kinase n=1 Tax=Anaerotaenia torta TaxID=433293 RepID=UPI003D1DFCF4
MNRISFLNNLPMWKKITLSYLFVISIPIGVSFFLMNSMRNVVMENAIKEVNNSMERVILRISQSLETVSSASYNIAYDASLSTAITSNYRSNYEFVRFLWEQGNLSPYIDRSDGNLKYLNYYIDSQHVLDNGYIKNTPKNIAASSWYQEAAGKSSAFWHYIDNPSFLEKDTKDLTLCRPIYMRGKFFGVLTAAVTSSRLQEILSQESVQTLLLDPDKTIVSSSRPELTGRSLGEAGLKQEGEHYLEITEGGAKSSLIVLSLPLTVSHSEGVFHIISLVPEASILEKTSQIIHLSNLIVLIGIIVSFTGLILFSKLLTKRLSRLDKDIRRAMGGDLDFVPVVDGRDEIGDLTMHLGRMLTNIHNLIQEVYLAQIQKQQLETSQKEIQLQVLNSQINPHFLFNILESIRMKAVTNSETEIASAIRMLSNILRKSLFTKNEPVFLSHELELVTSYLELQKFRFESLFHYKINVYCPIDNQKILPFLTQPIVENAFRHGIEEREGKRSGGFISVTVTREEDILIIRVADNGAGMKAEVLKDLKEKLESPPGASPTEHIGILNVHQRIQLVYGSDYGLSLTSEKDRGTIVTIRLPIITCI